MSVAEALTMLGGVATRAQLVGLTSRVEVDAALDGGIVVVERAAVESRSTNVVVSRSSNSIS